MSIRSKLKSVKSTVKGKFESAESKLRDSLDISKRLDSLNSKTTISPKLQVLEFPSRISAGPHIQFQALEVKAISTPQISEPVGLNKELKLSVFFPLPEGGFTDNTSVNYSQEEIGVFGKELINKITSGDFLKAPVETFNELYPAGSEVGKANLIKGVGDAIGVNVRGIDQQQNGRAINPNEAILFEKPNFREFTFSYKFYPRNVGESVTIYKIIRYFKKYSLPSLTSEKIWYSVPNRWTIKFGGNVKLPDIKTCVLSAVNVVYNESKNIFHSDGYANEITLTLTFKEVSVQTADDIDDII